MESAVSIILSKCPPLISSQVVRTKPDHCHYPVIGLPWELLHFADYTLSRQQRNMVGAHLQLFELDIQKDSSIYFRIHKPKKILFFLFHGHVRFNNLENKQLSEAYGPCFYLNYNPVCEVQMELTKGSLRFLAITLDQDWPIVHNEHFPAFSPLIEMWKTQSTNFVVLGQLPITKAIEDILIKIRLLLITNFDDNIELLKLISDCLSRYHSMLIGSDDYKQWDMLLRGKLLKDYLHENFADEKACLSTQIMLRLGWSEWMLRTISKKALGCTVFQYILKLKMNHAREQLEQTSLLVKEIALQLGFPDTGSFSRAFNKENGINPKNYRDKFKSPSS